MSKKPRILDTFCCEGGAGVGYARAGFEVFGVDMDKNRLKRYPFAVHYGNALEVLEDLGAGESVEFEHPDGQVESLQLEDFSALHGSPPCQGYTRGNAGRETSWPKLIPDVRNLFKDLGLPYVIENVKDAGPSMLHPEGLCGCMFDLSTVDTDGETIHLQRLRLFETNWSMKAPRACDHSKHEWVAGAYGGARRDKHEAKYVRKGGYVPADKAVVKALLGVEHDMTWNGLFESIPPAYTEHIGRQLLEMEREGKHEDVLHC